MVENPLSPLYRLSGREIMGKPWEASPEGKVLEEAGRPSGSQLREDIDDVDCSRRCSATLFNAMSERPVGEAEHAVDDGQSV